MKTRKSPLCYLAAVLLATATMAAACRACETALLVIDVQNVYVRDLDLTTIDGLQLVDRLAQVIAQARAAGLPVVYIQHRDPRFPIGSSEVAIAPEIAPHEGDPVVLKSYANAFWGTTLKTVLEGLGVRRLLIAGLATTGCVNATVCGAVQEGFETWVLIDAHSGGGSLDTLAYYNSTWPAVGATGIRSDAVDFAALGCTASTTP